MKIRFSFSINNDSDIYQSDAFLWPHDFLPQKGDTVIMESFVDFGEGIEDFASDHLFVVHAFFWTKESLILEMKKQ